MQIRRGMNRIAFLVGRVVIKFPVVMWKIRCHHDLIHAWQVFLAGVLANLTEYYTYFVFPQPFLVPVYFSIGLVSIQERDFGDEPTDKEVSQLFERLSKNAQWRLRMVDAHQTGAWNMRKGPHGYRFIDYGDKACYEGLPLSAFFLADRKELVEILKEVKQ